MTQPPPEINRSLTLLSDENRFTRKDALKTIDAHFKLADNIRSVDETTIVLCSSKLAHSLTDPIEVNRELAVEVVRNFLQHMGDLSPILPSLIPVLCKRLGCKEFLEPSEEIRVKTLALVDLVVQQKVDLSPYVDELLSIIHVTLADPFHEVKKSSCQILQALATRQYHQFYLKSELVLPALLGNLIHQHSKVRVANITALSVVLMHSQGKLVDNVIAPLTQRLFDDSASVRRCVIEAVGTWLLRLPDRYSYHGKLIPILLSGLTDESDEIREVTEDFWLGAGIQFEKENEEQLKDKLDFDVGAPAHYPLGCKRPTLGCRELVYRSASRWLPALCRDLDDWQSATRSKAACLLPIICLHLEVLVTQHAQQLLTGLATGLTNAVQRLSSSSNNLVLLRLVPAVAFRGLPRAPQTELSVNHCGPERLTPKLPTPLLAASSSDLIHLIKVTQQLLLTAQLLGCLIDAPGQHQLTHALCRHTPAPAQLWWKLMKSCLARCTESVAPTSLTGHLLLLAGLLSGSPVSDQLVPSADGSPDGLTAEEDVLGDILDYLTHNERLSAVSFGAKAALLECALTLTRRLEEAAVLLGDCGDPAAKIEGEDANRRLLMHNKLHFCLFHLFLSLAAVWPDKETRRTDFGSAFLHLTDEGIRRLAACEREAALLRAPPPPPDGESKLRDQAGGLRIGLLVSPVPADIDRLYAKHMPQLFRQLERDQNRLGSWHPRSVGLATLSHCLTTAGPALLMSCPASPEDATNSDQTPEKFPYVSTVIRLLQRGCRLDRPPGASEKASLEEDKSPAGSDPLTMASEAELRLRGLLLLTRLTETQAVRTVLASSDYLPQCLLNLALPACIWRAGRTAEAMRKAAVTSLVALIAAAAAVTSTATSSDESLPGGGGAVSDGQSDGAGEGKERNAEVEAASLVDCRRPEEVALDVWLCDHVEAVRQALGPTATLLQQQKALNGGDTGGSSERHPPPRTRFSSLSTLPANLLLLLLTRLGGLLEDDLEATRRMACLAVTLLLDGLLFPAPPRDCQGQQASGDDLLTSPVWLAKPKAASGQEGSVGTDERPEGMCCSPSPGSFGDAVYRFYPNLVKRLNDTKDKVRLLVTESINSWLRLVRRMLVCSPKACPGDTMNPVHSAVVSDFLTSVLPHLDDPDARMRGAVARIIARLGRIAPDLVRDTLRSARARHRAVDVCDKLIELVDVKEV